MLCAAVVVGGSGGLCQGMWLHPELTRALSLLALGCRAPCAGHSTVGKAEQGCKARRLLPTLQEQAEEQS